MAESVGHCALPPAPSAVPTACGKRADRPSRRGLLTGTALLGYWSQSQSRAQEAALLDLEAPAASLDLWLVRHTTMGLTEAEVGRVRALGYNGYLEYQLNYEAIDDSALDQRLAAYTTLTKEPFELYLGYPPSQVVNEFVEATILRSVFSQRQLYQRMVEFWTDHLSIRLYDDDTQNYLKPVDDREVIRKFALGKFAELLRASAYSPAMLYYLDNVTNRVGRPNENYARELLELHTLGVDNGYTQKDVEEVARCFTGWNYYPFRQGSVEPTMGKFRFVSSYHDNGQKTVLGHTIPANGGINDGDRVLDILASHPNTAGFVAHKLCAWWLEENPPSGLVNQVAATYLNTGGDIRQMLRTIFYSHEVQRMPLKYTRPYHQFVAGLRATSAAITATQALRSHLLAAGHAPYNWLTPDGYPDEMSHWVDLVLARWNFAAALLNSNISGLSVDINAFLGTANTADTIAERINQALFGGEMAGADKLRIRDFLLPDPPPTQRKRDAVGLALGAPGFQWY